MHRFKTEKEFSQELGRSWRSIVSGGWVDDMDRLLGTEIDLATYKLVTNTRSPNSYHGAAVPWIGWFISEQMVMEESTIEF